MRASRDATADFELALARRHDARLVLRLFVAGTTPRSSRAIVNLRALCLAHFPDAWDLEVIDVYQQPSLAREHQILVVPTLVRAWPTPERRIVGDLSNTERKLVGLQLRPAKPGK